VIFEQSIEINASATTVERCFTDLDLMRQWLNPALRCEAIGDWSKTVSCLGRSVIWVGDNSEHGWRLNAPNINVILL